MLPRLASKEAFLLIIQSAFLIFRTVLSILGAQLDGVIVRNLISGNGKGFLLGLVKWYLLALPSSYTNSILRFLQSKISIAFRYGRCLRRTVGGFIVKAAEPWIRFSRAGPDLQDMCMM